MTTTIPEQWEITKIGPTIISRTQNIAQDVQGYRDLINLKPNHQTQLHHNDYIHSIGQDMLKIQTNDPNNPIYDDNFNKKKVSKSNKLMRRNIKVSEMDDGGQSIMIDLEWDTSTWGDVELQGGIEALINLFQTNCSYDKKQQAVRMMTKLLERHEVAVKHMRSNIQPIMNRAISKRIINGTTLAALNLLYILNCSKNQFFHELSHNNFVGLFFEMLLLECKLAATIIQHRYRTYRELKQTKIRPLGELASGWGTQKEIYKSRQRSINLRTCDLKNKWKEMHYNMRKSDIKVLYGIRGPVHMDLTYDQLGLEIIEYLLSAKSLDNASRNREDGILSNSPIILSLFMSATRSSLSYLSLRILRHMALAPQSLLTFLPAGIINSCLKYLNFHYKIQKNSNPTHIIETLELITRLGHHAAGIERAIHDWSYQVTQGTYCDDTHPLIINYKEILKQYNGKIPDFRKNLGSKEVCQWLYQLVMASTDIKVLRAALMTMYLLSCSICYTNILEILIQSAGLLLTKIIDFLEYSNHEEECILGDLSLCILLQQCTHESSREGLLSSNITTLLRPLYHETIFFHRLSYKRALAIMISLCRIGELRAYDPMKLFFEIQKSKQLIYFTYMDLMKTIKQPPPEKESLQYSMNFNDLILLPSDPMMCSELSDLASRVGITVLLDYFTCPLDEKYFSTLSWEMASSGCYIISALITNIIHQYSSSSSTSSANTIQKILSSHVIKYLGNCFYFGFTEISNKVLTEYESRLYLSGCYAAVESLVQLCHLATTSASSASSATSTSTVTTSSGLTLSSLDNIKIVIHSIIETNAASAANYFLNIFSNSFNTMLPPKIKESQELVALTSIKFLERYTNCLLKIHSIDNQEIMLNVANTIGIATCRVLKSLHEVFGHTPKTLRILDDLCQLLTRLTEPAGGTSLALQSWNIIESLVIHLPQPYTHYGNIFNEELVYRNGILLLPRSLFDLMSSLCKIEQGKALCYSEGFLRRALDKIALTAHYLEDDEELAFRIKQIQQNSTTTSTSTSNVSTSGGKRNVNDEIDQNRLNIASCLRLVALSCNYNNPKYGSSNEMILHPNYRIIEICSRILNSFVCLKHDEAYLSCLKLLRYLARDSHRVYDIYKSYHIITIIAREIQYMEQIPLDGIIDMVDFTYHIAIGMKGKHVRKELPKMKESLIKIARIYFRLGEGVSDVLWAISRNHEGDHIDLINEGPMEIYEIEEIKRQSIQQDLIEKKITLKPGSYEACGVGTCGSLRLTDTPCSHGEYEEKYSTTTTTSASTSGSASGSAGITTNTEKMMNVINQQRSHDPNRLELTKEFANKKLQQEVKKRKKMMGLLVDEELKLRKNETLEDDQKNQDKRQQEQQNSTSPSPSPSSSGMFPLVELNKSHRQLYGTNISVSSSLNSLHSLTLQPPTYEPLWKAQKKKIPSQQDKKKQQKKEIEVITVDVKELPQLLATKPPKPSMRMQSP